MTIKNGHGKVTKPKSQTDTAYYYVNNGMGTQ